jgi:hypothetical protein
MFCLGLDHIFIWLGPALPLPNLLHCPVFLPALAWQLFLVGNQCDNTWSFKPLSSFGTPSINLGIMKVMSTWNFVILTMYCHTGSQRGRVLTKVRAGRQGNEGGIRGARRAPTEWRCDLAQGRGSILNWSATYSARKYTLNSVTSTPIMPHTLISPNPR